MARKHFFPDLKGIWSFIIDGKSDWKPKLLAIVAIVYLIWPLDLIPDIAPILGWMDDLGFVGFASWYLMQASEEYMRRVQK